MSDIADEDLEAATVECSICGVEYTGFGHECAKPLGPLVVVVRDPDASNDYRVFDGTAETYDIDLGRSALNDAGEFADWAESHLREARRLEVTRPEAATYIRDVVEGVRSQHDHPDPIICCDDGCGLHVNHEGECAPR